MLLSADRLLAPLLALAATFAVALPASAAAPSAKSKTIVPVTSIGGIKLGQSYSTAMKAWGTGSNCGAEDEQYRQNNGGAELDRTTFTGSCTWRVDETSSTAGTAGLLFEQGKVTEVSLFCAQDPATFEPTGKGPIGTFKLKKGKTKLGCGSRISKLIKTYPKAKATPSGVALYQKDRMLSFGSSGGKVSGIALLYAKNY